MLHRKVCIAGVLALGSCGGLAADGLEPGSEARAADCPQEDCLNGLAPDEGAFDGRPGAESGRGAPERRPAFVEPEAAPREPSVGDACGPSPEGGERITIGKIVLEASGNCGAGHLCLLWAGVDPTCLVAEDGPGCDVVDRDDEFVPVPPSLAPISPAQARVCTCRCAGGEGDHCSCPEGMSCRELIRSSGANGAAADFVGSYCSY